MDNMTQNTYTVKTEDGKTMTEQVTKNKDTNDIKRNLDGKHIKPSLDDKDILKPTTVSYVQGNGDMMQILILKQILNQLKEMNYYLRLQVKDDIDDKKVLEAINHG